MVEDIVFFKRAISKVLLEAGHEVVIANDGRDALELLEAGHHTFDLVVSDIEMPRMNGFELAKAIRASGSHSALPLLAISSRADKSSKDLGIKSGFNIYLEKLKAETLLGAVAELAISVRRSA